MTLTRKILVIHAHPFPRKSRVNRALREAIRDLDVSIHDIYELYPDFQIDVAREQEALAKADTLVLQHPFYWYSAPPLLKEWIDSTLKKGFAYGEGGTALQGKNWLQAISTAGPESAYRREGYNHFTMEELLRPFEQTAYLCGMRPLKPFLVHWASRISDEEIQAKANAYRSLLNGMLAGENPPTYSTLGPAHG